MIDEMIDDDHDHDKDVDHMSICIYSKALDSLDDEDEKWKQIKVDVDDFFDSFFMTFLNFSPLR